MNTFLWFKLPRGRGREAGLRGVRGWLAVLGVAPLVSVLGGGFGRLEGRWPEGDLGIQEGLLAYLGVGWWLEAACWAVQGRGRDRSLRGGGLVFFCGRALFGFPSTVGRKNSPGPRWVGIVFGQAITEGGAPFCLVNGVWPGGGGRVGVISRVLWPRRERAHGGRISLLALPERVGGGGL